MNLGLLSIPLNAILEVVFFKRDELTTDLVCCEIIVRRGDSVERWFYHEELPEWGEVLNFLERLPDFDTEWPGKVMQPAFEENRTIAFQRSA